MPWVKHGSAQVSIIVPCREHARELRSCLQGLQNQDGQIEFEVLVVDSDCDRDVATVAQGFSLAKLVRPPRGMPLSAGAARNLGVEHAAATVLGMIDADCVPEQGWVEAAWGLFVKAPCWRATDPGSATLALDCSGR
jgi:glycosyltransferase involved in cell wall biosynthesis